jgi:hypothetical protein
VVAGELLPLDVADTAAPGGGAPASLPPIFHLLSHMNFHLTGCNPLFSSSETCSVFN